MKGGLSPAGWFFLLLAWGLIGWGTLFCFRRILFHKNNDPGQPDRDG